MVPDGLYLAIAPNIKTSEGGIVSVQPVAALLEIRSHTFKPFRFPILLIPDQESPFTPKPRLPPEAPVRHADARRIARARRSQGCGGTMGGMGVMGVMNCAGKL